MDVRTDLHLNKSEPNYAELKLIRLTFCPRRFVTTPNRIEINSAVHHIERAEHYGIGRKYVFACCSWLDSEAAR